jgi:hypothetical protein
MPTHNAFSSNGELYHAGVKGMKWGVRKDKKPALASATVKTTRSGNTTITSRNGKQKAKLTTKRNRGAKLVAKNENVKLKVVISNTANVTAGALRVAAAFVPGLSVLNGVATAASLVGTVATLKK